jgi:hypothetical protein
MDSQILIEMNVLTKQAKNLQKGDRIYTATGEQALSKVWEEKGLIRVMYMSMMETLVGTVWFDPLEEVPIGDPVSRLDDLRLK